MHWGLGLIIFLVLGIFVTLLAVRFAEGDVLSGSMSLLLVTGIQYYIVWLLMVISTVVLVKEWNKQFGENY